MDDAIVDLRSDTVTRPPPGMRRAIADAEVGDDVLDGDPTTRALEERVAALLGQERALFFPSGIMANQAALAVLGRPGTDVLCDTEAHILVWEDDAAAALSGLQLRGLPAPGGLLDVSTLDAGWRPPSRLTPRVSILALENTHLGSGGRILPVADLERLAGWARERDLRVHLDGARLWHAAVAADTPASAWGRQADTVMVTLSKGLCCPAGSLLAGAEGLMEEAWRVRRRLGGAMRQSGMLAAAGLWALDHVLPGLADDHAKAGHLARELGRHAPLEVTIPETNVVMIDLPEGGPEAGAALGALAREGVRVSRFGARRLRCVTHRDVSWSGVEKAVAVLGSILTA